MTPDEATKGRGAAAREATSLYANLRGPEERKVRISIGSDHAGFELKMKLLPYLQEYYEVTDCGCFSADPVDFPDIAKQVCRRILAGEADRGIMFCGSGVGAVIACNKVRGIRAALCHDVYSAHQAVEHDHVQVLALGNQIIGEYAARDIIDIFLHARYSEGEEFRRRVEKLEHMNEGL